MATIMKNPLTPLINKLRSFPDEKILYKRFPDRDAVMVKPNTFRWRVSYWLNQKLNDFTIWIMHPLYMRWYEWWRINEGDEIISGRDRAYRKDLIIYTVDGLNIGFRLPERIVKNAEWVKDKFQQLRWATDKEKVETYTKNPRAAYQEGYHIGFRKGYEQAKEERNNDWENMQLARVLIKLFAKKFGVAETEIVRALKEEDGIK